MATRKNNSTTATTTINTTATVVTLTKNNTTVDFVQFHEGTVIYIVNKVPTVLPTAVAIATIKQYMKDGWGKVENPAEEKLYAPKEPKTTEEKKAEREQKLTEKYGDIETRRAYVQKRQTIWAEESAKIAEAVKNGEMKRLRKDEWKALMNERVNARLSA